MEKDHVILIYALILITIIAISAYLFAEPHGSDFSIELLLVKKFMITS